MQPASTRSSSWRPGYSLPQSHYTNTERFSDDLRLLGEHTWLLVDHASRIPAPGDFFLFEFGSNSIIVVRNPDGAVRAFHNVCRHRGSLMCVEPEGHARTLTCQYHGWSYRLDGTLAAARHMPRDFDPAEQALLPCHVRVHAGLIFLNLTEGQPPSFDDFIAPAAPLLAPYHLDRAKIAASRTFPTMANWKLCVENFLECYHCKTAHPTYSSIHDEQKLLAFGAGPGSGDELASAYAAVFEAWQKTEEAQGRPVQMFSDGPDAVHFQSGGRVPIGRGHLTESLSGRPLAPSLLSNGTFDGAQTGVVTNAVSIVLASSDHVVLFRITPRATMETDFHAIWLVRGDAVAGVDYDAEELIKVWTITATEDKKITEDNQKGVLSPAYRPGRYSSQEQRIADFATWYQQRLASVVACSELPA